MPAAPHEILLVTPVWNDSARLADFGPTLAKALSAALLPVRWIIADDGSGVDERARLEKLRGQFAEIYPRVETHFAAQHRGKGGVVKEAWGLYPQADWLTFVDADGSTGAEDFMGLITRGITSGSSVLGVRKRTDSTRIEESLLRGLTHRGFLLAVRLLLGLRCADPQCGAKVLKGGDYRRVAAMLHEQGYAFDSELLAALHGQDAQWIEVPVSWVEKKGGKIRMMRDALLMLAALLRIRAALRAGGSHIQAA